MTDVQTQCQPTHIAYADETSYNVGRFRGIGVISLALADARLLSKKLRHIIPSREFKWQDLRSADMQFLASDMLKIALHFVETGLMRIDVITWDTQDDRHNIQGRDDLANLNRMYYHVLHNVFSRRWSSDCVWRLCPDENSVLDWGTIYSCLNSVSYRDSLRTQVTSEDDAIVLWRKFNICEIIQCESHEEPVIQLADLLVGLGVYSRQRYEIYEQWNSNLSRPQATLAVPTPNERRMSQADYHRCQVLAGFFKQCTTLKLGVNLKGTKGLRTYAPGNPVNFWQYQSQHSYDRAPVKSKPIHVDFGDALDRVRKDVG